MKILTFTFKILQGDYVCVDFINVHKHLYSCIRCNCYFMSGYVLVFFKKTALYVFITVFNFSFSDILR